MALTERLRLWDTCSYVRRFSERRVDEQIAADIRARRFLLCSVVAMELYAGTRDAPTKRALDELVRDLGELGLVVTPDLSDYQRVGIAIGRYGRRRGTLDPRAHFRDALITACAAKREATIVSENVSDFARWSKWLGRHRVRAWVPRA